MEKKQNQILMVECCGHCSRLDANWQMEQDERYIALETRDGREVIIPASIAVTSGTLASLLNGPGTWSETSGIDALAPRRQEEEAQSQSRRSMSTPSTDQASHPDVVAAGAAAFEHIKSRHNGMAPPEYHGAVAGAVDGSNVTVHVQVETRPSGNMNVHEAVVSKAPSGDFSVTSVKVLPRS